MSSTREHAHGNWRSILIHLGVDPARLVNKHGPCPMCGGKDRFRWDDQNGNGGFICSGCGGGDGFMLAQRITGKSFKEVAVAIDELLGKPSTFQVKGPDPLEVAQRNAMSRVWQGAWQPSFDSPVGEYLGNRVGCLWPSNAIREASYGSKGWFMVAKVVDHIGERAVNIHLTAITKDGRKQNVSPAKKVMPGKLPDGCAIRLGPVKPVMGVAEGIETAISAAILFDMPVWACVNGTLLSKWIPPEGCEQVTVFGDNDENYTGQAKAFHLANRLEVQFKRRVSVMIPPMTGQDWNDHHHATWSQPGGHLRLVK